jgi:hypothetical protein
LCFTLIFWRHYDARGIDLRRDRKNGKHRGGFRAGIRWPVSMEASIGSIQGRTKNVSVSGATIVSLHPLSRGEIVHFTLRAPGRVIRLRGQIMWTQTFHPAMSRIPHKAIGVLFQGLSEIDKVYLASSVEAWREAQARQQAEAPRRSFSATWLGGDRGGSGSAGRQTGGGLGLERAFHGLRERMDGVVGQTFALFRPYDSVEAPVRSKGHKAGARLSQ